MRRVRVLAPVALAVTMAVLSGCSSSPEAEVRDDVAAVIAAANDASAGGVRTAVDDLLATLRSQVGSGTLTAAEAEPVRAAAIDVRDSIALLEVEQTPSPEPTQEPTEEPSRTPSATPEPEPTAEPEPEPEPTEPPVTSAPAEPTEPPGTTAPAEPTEAPQETPEQDEGEDKKEDKKDKKQEPAAVPPSPPVSATPLSPPSA